MINYQTITDQIKRNELESAKELIDKALHQNPDDLTLNNLLCAYFQKKGLTQEALAVTDKIIQIYPRASAGYLNRSVIFNQAGQPQQAIQALTQGLLHLPDDISLLTQVAGLHFADKDFKKAKPYLVKLSDLRPQDNNILNFLAKAHIGLKDWNEAYFTYQTLEKLDPSNADWPTMMAICLFEDGETDRAFSQFERSASKFPENFVAYFHLGLISQDKSAHQNAIDYYSKAIELKPNYVQAINNLGVVYQNSGLNQDAIDCFIRTIAIAPNEYQAHLNLAKIFTLQKDLEQAQYYIDQAKTLAPNDPGVCNNQGVIYQEQKRVNDSIQAYEKALSLLPNHPDALTNLYHQYCYGCMWRKAKALNSQISELTLEILSKNSLERIGTPFIHITRTSDLKTNYLVAKRESEYISTVCVLDQPFQYNWQSKDKLRIGYLSCDFYNHATAHLMLELFKKHDKNTFEIYSYSYGPDDKSDYRKSIVECSDKFKEVGHLSNFEAAKLINEDQIDILVDLKGHTKDNRLGICAYRPSPVQISYLGFPGTTGASFIDFGIVDPTIVPQSHRQYYSENLVFMPDSYQVNNTLQVIDKEAADREKEGLPKDAVVLASFNQSYKIEKSTFDIWLKVLQQFEDTVLWLLDDNDTARKNLLWEAKQFGISEGRLIFAKSTAKEKHLGRTSLADLAVDTWLVNGHTTTSDALYSNVPVVTMLGEHFASRVSASLLKAVGMPELITETPEQYFNKIAELLKDREMLAGLKEHLSNQKLSSPLFNTSLFTTHIETAYKKIWEQYLSRNNYSDIHL